MGIKENSKQTIKKILGKRSPLTAVGLFMRRPISVCVIVFAVAFGALMAVNKMQRDILPSLGVPMLYVAQSFGGLDPSQMESYITYFDEAIFLFIDGVEHFESKNIQGVAIIKIQFMPGTDMSNAMAQTVAFSEQARSFMPPGNLPPFVIRLDSGSAPVGKLVFSTKTRTLSEVQNLALNNVRPLFASLGGVSSPAPFGAGSRSIVVEVDPQKLANNDLSPDAITNALVAANTIIPSGNLHIGSMYPIIPINSAVNNPQELLKLPLRLGVPGSTLLGDVARIIDTSDIPTGYALVNGRRTIYIPITKRAEASTLAVVDSVKASISRFQAVLPDDIKVSFEFDQSGYVRSAISSLFVEALLGAVLTGLMVLLFLRDFRSVVIVVINIPLALMFSLFSLWICGQTINVMTLGGLALAVGILVDETTVTIENIHTHLSHGSSVPRAALEATNEILKPAILSLLCVLSVFIPSFFMEGVAHSLFGPLTLAVGFSMIGSFILSRTLVPVLSVWLLKHDGQYVVHGDAHQQKGFFFKVQSAYSELITGLMRFKKPMVLGYFAVCFAVIFICGSHIGMAIFPKVDGYEMQFRLKGPTGTYFTSTEQITLKVIDFLKEKVGEQNVATTVAYVGSQPPNFALNNIFLWTSGPQEAVVEVAFKPEAKIVIEDLKEYLRQTLKEKMPDVEISFEPSNLVDRTMSQGSDTPIEIGISGAVITTDIDYSKKVLTKISSLDYLRDVQIRERFDYPTIEVNADRNKLGHNGLTMAGLGAALIPATSSSRYVHQNLWRDPSNGIAYSLQVQVPREYLTSIESFSKLPIQSPTGDVMPLSHYAQLKTSTTFGEADRYNMQRMVAITANLHNADLGRAARDINAKLKELEGEKPKGVFVHFFGQLPALEQMVSGLSGGLGLAILVVFLLLAANFESLTVSASVLSTAPAVIMGALLMLLATKSTLNIQSFMGLIMAIGVAVANAILLVTFAERARKTTNNSSLGALEGAKTRLRPILMTSGAMLAGMIPMASGLSEGGEQMAPLGRAVLGGVLASTVATLVFLPLVFAWIQEKRSVHHASLDPNDTESRYHETYKTRQAPIATPQQNEVTL
jgi:multidrug efflux pump subunit AcrB